jgi:hypothetical protein
MGDGDGADNREPESGTASVRQPVAVEPAEWLEQQADRLIGDRAAAIRDAENASFPPTIALAEAGRWRRR